VRVRIDKTWQDSEFGKINYGCSGGDCEIGTNILNSLSLLFLLSVHSLVAATTIPTPGAPTTSDYASTCFASEGFFHEN
jgi:hypothetical protein